MDQEDINKIVASNKVLQKKLDQSMRARKQLEDLRERTQKLFENVNNELVGTINQLNETQAQLVQSEKMAGLGQLIAGISHEINTPAGAITSAIQEISKDYISLLEKLIYIVNTSTPEIRKQYFAVCSIGLKVPSEYSTSENRQISRQIEKVLAEHEIKNARTISKNLASVGFQIDHLEIIIPLLKSPLCDAIHESLFMLGMTRIHTRDIQISIGKIINLVKALKLYSRTDHNEFGETDIAKDIIMTLTILHNRLKYGIVVEKEFSPIPNIFCIAEQLNQVWTNIINNSIEAMQGKGKIIIRLKQIDQENILIEFVDTGPGIPDDVLPRIFEAYFTTKPKGEGTGLGLYISNEIINKHNGKIEVITNPTGTSFRIILPIKGVNN